MRDWLRGFRGMRRKSAGIAARVAVLCARGIHAEAIAVDDWLMVPCVIGRSSSHTASTKMLQWKFDGQPARLSAVRIASLLLERLKLEGCSMEAPSRLR